MKVKTIEGIYLQELKEIFDVKGSVLHMIRNDDKYYKNFGECYLSQINRDCVKGWKKHSLQTQNIAVPIGQVKFVIYDPRHESKTYKNTYEIILGRPDSYSRITIPTNVWYSFKCVSEIDSLVVNCTDIPHDKEESITLPIDTIDIPYSWKS
jgi:dTDP-4-dehydrorhamnose 3,5-epimerase